MSKPLLEEVAKVYNGKKYLVIGLNKEKAIILDMATSKVVSTTAVDVYNNVSLLANAQSKGLNIEVDDISLTRLASISEGDILNFSYVVKRYKDENDNTLGYLMFVFTNKNTVQLVKLNTQDALRSFEHGIVLNAKKVVRNGQELIAGIVKPIPEDTYTTNGKEGGVSKKANPLYKRYLAKAEKRYIRNLLHLGFAESPTENRDKVKAMKRYIDEVVQVEAPELYQWYKKMPTKVRLLNALDAYILTKVVKDPTKVGNKHQKGYAPSFQPIKRAGNTAGIIHPRFRASTLNFIYSHVNDTQGITKVGGKITKTTKNFVLLGIKGVINIADTGFLQQEDAIQEKLKQGKIAIFSLDGVLMTDLPSMPIPQYAKEFFYLRDAFVCEPYKLERSIILKEHKDIIKNWSNTKGMSLFTDKLMRLAATHPVEKYMLADINKKPISYRKELNYTAHKISRETKEFKYAEYDWGHKSSFIAMNVSPYGMTETDIFYYIDENTKKFPLMKTFYKKFSGDINVEHLCDVFDLDPSLIVTVGDAIILYSIFNRIYANDPSTTKSRREFILRYGVKRDLEKWGEGFTEIDMTDYLSVLAMGNKDLAKAVIKSSYFAQVMKDYENIMITEAIIDELPYLDSIFYRSGLRIGDGQQNQTVTYNTTVSYKKLRFHNNEETREKLEQAHKMLLPLT